jgi:hypothetical protein
VNRLTRYILPILLYCAGASAVPVFRPHAFIGSPPGMAQFHAIQIQRHQARTLLYREALEELRSNPAAADVPVCEGAVPTQGALCLARAAPAPTEILIEGDPAKSTGPSSKPTESMVTTPRRRLAILIGNNGYKKPIPELETPIADVGKTADILKERFGFEVKVLKDASKSQIIEALNRVAEEATPEDSVLLFYAGHGYLMQDTKMGFWIPVDASVKSAVGWISNTDIAKLLSAIKARQLILVSDSCFSGSLTKEQKVGDSAASKPDDVLRRRSVLVLASGGDEPVSDEGKDGHSVFAWNLIDTLQSIDGITPGYEVYRSVRGRVMKDSPQEPQYGAVVSAGHVAGGEYLFETSAVSGGK